MVKSFSEDFPIWPFIIYTMACQSKLHPMRGQINLDHESDVVPLNFEKHKKMAEKSKSKKNREKWSF